MDHIVRRISRSLYIQSILAQVKWYATFVRAVSPGQTMPATSFGGMMPKSDSRIAERAVPAACSDDSPAHAAPVCRSSQSRKPERTNLHRARTHARCEMCQQLASDLHALYHHQPEDKRELQQDRMDGCFFFCFLKGIGWMLISRYDSERC